jgi:DNA-binding response OmpR family regulator
MKSILVADGPDMDERLAAVLAGHELAFARSLQQATALLASRDFDLVMVGVHFDESRMFDLLRHVRSGGRNSQARIVCVLGHRFESPAISIEGLEIATRALAADAFVDLSRYAEGERTEQALRKVVEPLLKS